MTSIITNNMKSGNYLDGLTNYFYNNKSGKNANTIRFGANDNRTYFYLNENEYGNLNTFKTWLSTHNTIVYYVLATPDTIDITDEILIAQLDTLYTAEMSNGINYINTNTENVLPYINLKYNMITTPRPNPEHPVDIETINGHQAVQMHGKQLISLKNATYSHNGIEAVVNNGEITLNGTATSTAFIEARFNNLIN